MGRSWRSIVAARSHGYIQRSKRCSTTPRPIPVRKPGAKLVVTGCLAERAGDELAAALPEVDAVVGFGGEGSLAQSVSLGPPRRKPSGVRDLLELPRAAPSVPWAYVKIAEGCDRACAFCAIRRSAASGAHAGVDRPRCVG
jgi:tRNA A37 methylthiotransferase MiaB